MLDLKIVLLIMKINFKKWTSNHKIMTLAVTITVYLSYHLQGLLNFLIGWDIHISPWIFPHLISDPVLMLAFSLFTTLLFCDAPFIDKHTPFLIIRSGRKNWIVGQFLYILVASFLYTVFVNFIIILTLVFRLDWSIEWGSVFFTFARDKQFLPDNIGVFVSEQVITFFSPLQAFLISFGLFWLVSTFIGVLIFSCNSIIKKASGLIAMGLVFFMLPFSMIVGRIMFSFGDKLIYFSPLSWMGLAHLDLDGTTSMPTLPYVVTTLIISIIIMSYLTIKVFCMRDIDLKGDDL